ncbi:MAG: hypothetical protein JXR37_20510 [Kiritimatiellae bacterium]|nr:hypothetical protein [Kiritimatiellia bacterium]
MSATCVEFEVERLPELFEPDPARIRLACARQAAVWAGGKPDRYPILLHAPLTPAQKAIPAANYRDAFYDEDRMLCAQVRGACGVSNAGSDAVPSIRSNLGTGVLLACVGLEQDVFEDKMPWLRQHMSQERVGSLTGDDIGIRGSFARGLAHMRRFRAVMGDALALYCMDTQGPFDLAHLLLGEALFMALYDDPPFVHRVMEFCVELTIRTTRWMKEIAGEADGRIHHSNHLYAENMGVRICEDTTALISPECIAEFAMPYTQKVAQAFGGAWIHYCGRNDHLTEAALAIPEVRGINFGHVPGHVHDHPFEQDMQRCLDRGKVYVGNWPRYDGESGRAYLDRLYRWAAQGCLIPAAGAALRGEDGFGSVAEALDYWYSLQA